jgi:hypothetical protein
LPFRNATPVACVRVGAKPLSLRDPPAAPFVAFLNDAKGKRVKG